MLEGFIDIINCNETTVVSLIYSPFFLFSRDALLNFLVISLSHNMSIYIPKAGFSFIRIFLYSSVLSNHPKTPSLSRVVLLSTYFYALIFSNHFCSVLVE
jgi:hypothetical protein